MKKLFLPLLVCITLFSCEKQAVTVHENQQLSTNGSIQYKVNGTLTIMDNVNVAAGQYALCQKYLKGAVFPQTRYMLSAQKGLNNSALFAIITDSLQQINYHYDSISVKNNDALAMFFTVTNTEQADLVFTGDYFDVNITSYKDSRVSGTFTAKYTPILSNGFGVHGSTIITEGVINNVQVIY